MTSPASWNLVSAPQRSVGQSILTHSIGEELGMSHTNIAHILEREYLGCDRIGQQLLGSLLLDLLHILVFLELLTRLHVGG